MKIKRRIVRVRSQEPGRFIKRKTRGFAKNERFPNQDKFHYKRRDAKNQANFSPSRRQKKKKSGNEKETRRKRKKRRRNKTETKKTEKKQDGNGKNEKETRRKRKKRKRSKTETEKTKKKQDGNGKNEKEARRKRKKRKRNKTETEKTKKKQDGNEKTALDGFENAVFKRFSIFSKRLFRRAVSSRKLRFERVDDRLQPRVEPL